MENKRIIGIEDKNGNMLYEGALVEHDSIDGVKNQRYTIKWSDYRNQWIGDCPDEIYDLSSQLLAESVLITENPQP